MSGTGCGGAAKSCGCCVSWTKGWHIPHRGVLWRDVGLIHNDILDCTVDAKSPLDWGVGVDISAVCQVVSWVLVPRLIPAIALDVVNLPRSNIACAFEPIRAQHAHGHLDDVAELEIRVVVCSWEWWNAGMEGSRKRGGGERA